MKTLGGTPYFGISRFILQLFTLRDGGRDSYFRTRPGSAVLFNNWKLIKYFECDSLELYDLKTDTGERTNLVKQNPKKTEQMLHMMSRWQKKTHASIPSPKNL